MPGVNPETILCIQGIRGLAAWRGCIGWTREVVPELAIDVEFRYVECSNSSIATCDLVFEKGWGAKVRCFVPCGGSVHMPWRFVPVLCLVSSGVQIANTCQVRS